KYLVVSVSDGTTSRKNRVIVMRHGNPSEIKLVDNHDDKYSFVDNDGPIFYFRTEWHAPKGQVIAIDINQPDPKNWKTLIPEAKDTLQAVSMVDNKFICDYLQDAKSVVKVFDATGKFL